MSVLSWLIYRWWDFPAWRFVASSPKHVFIRGGGIPVDVYVAPSSLLISMQEMLSSFPERLNLRRETHPAFSNRTIGRCNESDSTADRSLGDWILGCRKGSIDFLLVEDSHANYVSTFFDVPGKDAELRGFEITRSSPPFIPVIYRWTGIDGDLRLHENVVDRDKYGGMNQIAGFTLMAKS